jgi:hypothetical protein
MLGVIASIPDAMILEPLLPHFHVRAEFLLRPKGKPAFDELNRLLQARHRRQKDMDMVRHNDEFMQKISHSPVVIESVDKKPCPSVIVEKRATFPRGRGSHVRLSIVGGVFSLRLHWCFRQSLSG